LTCAQFKELVTGLAFGTLDASERAACEAHLREGAHEGCREALADAERVAGALHQSAAPVKPPAKLWPAIERQLGEGDAAAPRRRSFAAVLPWLAAAVLLIALALVGWSRHEVASQLARAEAERARLAETVALLSSPNARVVSLAAQAGAPAGLAAVALVDLENRRGLVIVGGVTPQPGKDLELWVIRGDEKRAAGLIRGSGNVLQPIDPKLLAGGADALAVTLEPEGGGPAPRGPAVLVGPMPKT
jgi:anti-sigma-K factor RskA